MSARSSRGVLLLAGSVLGATALSGCSALADDHGDGPHVVTAFYALEFVAERVAGEHGEVTNLTQPGTEPHDLELTIAETAEIARSDLVVHLAGFQPAVDDSVAQNAAGEVLDVGPAADLVPFEEDPAEHAEHDEDEAHEHGHGDVDPHFWLDPLRMADVADALAEELAGIDPEHTADYTANAEALRADLEALDQEYTRGLADCERDTIVVSHDAFGYLERYGLHVAPVAGLSPDAEPTPANLGRLQELIRDEGVTTVFSERLASRQFTEPLAEDLGLRTAILDPVEGLTDQTADDDYLSLMEQNLTELEEANGCR